MKLILAIVHDEDGGKVMATLNSAGFSVTKLATTGGFLRTGNTTLLIGTDENKVDEVMDILVKQCQKRKQITTTPIATGLTGMFTPYPVEVEVGGATIFQMNVDRFEKI